MLTRKAKIILIVSAIGVVLISLSVFLLLWLNHNSLSIEDSEASNNWKYVYVSPSGKDTNTGTKTSPYLTIEKAYIASKTLLKSSSVSGVTIYLDKGQYQLTAPLSFSAGDIPSGKMLAFKEWHANSYPVISGGKKVTGWTKSGTKYVAALPTGVSTDTFQLYINSVPASPAEEKASAVMKSSSANESNYTIQTKDQYYWSHIETIKVVFMTGWQKHICSASAFKNTITIDPKCSSNYMFAPEGSSAPKIISFLGSSKFLNKAGEFFIDKSTRKIKYIPRTGEKMSKDEAIVPYLNSLIEIKGTQSNPVSNLYFTGLTFSYSTWAKPKNMLEFQAQYIYTKEDSTTAPEITAIPSAIHVQYAKSITFINNRFFDIGSNAIWLDTGTQKFTVKGNYFDTISSGGVMIGNEKAKETNVGKIVKNNKVDSNIFTNIAWQYESSVPIFLMFTQNITVSRNEIYDSPYSAISVGWGWGSVDPSLAKNNKIEANRIDHALNGYFYDGGGIYTLGAQPGSSIVGNYITNTTLQTSREVNGGAGIYLDQRSRYWTVQGNMLNDNRKSLLVNGAGDSVFTKNYWQNRYAKDLLFIPVETYSPCLPTACGKNDIRNDNLDISQCPQSTMEAVKAVEINRKILDPKNASQKVVNNSVELIWSPIPGAKSYLVRVFDATTNQGACTPLANGSIKPGSCLTLDGSTYRHTFVGVSGHKYNWWVHAVYNTNGDYSDAVGESFTLK